VEVGWCVGGCRGWLPERGGWRVAASKLVDRIDPVTRSLFGVGRKTLPEKFSGGGWPEKVAVAGGDRVAGGTEFEVTGFDKSIVSTTLGIN
ncbi:hypothetical protein Tco_1308682, partial [Tanacetum coccineum]